MPPKRFKRKNFKKKPNKRVKIPRSPRGYVTIVRKSLSQLLTTNLSGTAGTAVVRDPAGLTGTSLFVGTPVLSFGAIIPNVYDIPFAMKFSLSEILAYSDLTQLADRYKILNVKINVHGYNTDLVNYPTNNVPSCWVEYTNDYDDYAVPSISQFDERMGIKTRGFNQRGMLTLGVKPRAPMRVNGDYTPLSVPARSQWIDCASPDVPHFGIKGVIRNVNLISGGTGCAIRFQPHYTIAGKDFQ